MIRMALISFVAIVSSLGAQSPIPPHLTDYVRKTDDVFAWSIDKSIPADESGSVKLKLTSQKWQNETWTHDVQIFLPKAVKPTATVLLYNTGGSSGPTSVALGQALADRIGAPVVFLFGIPKQPLYGKREDALIAETFVKFLETRDPSWPLLFPMVKSVVRCMDAVQAFAQQEWKQEVSGFIVSGASKRGWTSWLTAATGDPRVKAIAPMVIDTLNFQQQMPNQVKSFGRYSAMIKDYEDRKLLPLPDTAEARQLWAMVDPWVYREKLALPKLIINGTNDPYWAQDALNYYWDDLPGPKYVLYVPNAGHDLRPMKDPQAERVEKDLFPMKAVDTLAAFSRSIIFDQPLPKATVKLAEDKAGTGKIDVTFDHAPKSVRAMKATSPSRDFRKQKWNVESTLSVQPGVPASVEMATSEPFTAFFLECEYTVDGKVFCLSTPIRIVEKK